MNYLTVPKVKNVCYLYIYYMYVFVFQYFHEYEGYILKNISMALFGKIYPTISFNGKSVWSNALVLVIAIFIVLKLYHPKKCRCT
jgi:hypothetical protein